MVFVDAKVFVHVEQSHFAPINSPEVDQIAEKLNLRIAGGQNGGGLALPLDGLDEIIVHGLGDIRGHVGFGCVNAFTQPQPTWRLVRPSP